MPCRLGREEVVTIQVLHAKQVPHREVARQLGVSEGTVRYHLRKAAAGATDGRKDKPFAAAAVAEVIECWVAHHKATERPANIRALYEHLVAEHGYVGSYRSVLRYVRHRWGRPQIRTYRRVETPAGAQSQTDWGEYPRVDLGAGPERLSAFVMVLSHSRMPAVVWSRRKDLVSWLHCHNEAFRRLRGIPAVNRIDNTKTAVVDGAGPWGTIHPVYRAYARAVGFHIDACLPRQPQAKGKTEAKVRLCRQLVDPRGCRFESLAHLQAETDVRVSRWAERAICPATGSSVAASWCAEQARLAPLPLLPEPFDVSVSRPVHRDCMVHFESRQYAVPFAYVGRHVEVRGAAGQVQILHDGRVLREYPRGTAERVLIDPSCYEGKATERALPPPPLGRLGARLEEIYRMPVEQRPLDLYAALAEVAR